LMLDRREALTDGREFRLLQLDERRHVLPRIAVREMEHRIVEAVKAGKRDELELVAHCTELALEAGDRRVVEILLPVERRRAVVCKKLVRKLRVDRFGERLRECKIGLAGFAPDQIRVARV